MDVKISVIIPSYKPGDYLWECLGSLYNQTYPKDQFEVILILNGCNEPYHQQIRAYLDNHKSLQVRLIQTDNGGVSNARNIGLDESRGEYITFIDDDDFISQTYLEELCSKATPDIVSVCYPLSFEDGTENYVPYSITRDYISNEGNPLCDYIQLRRFFTGPVYKLIHRDIIGQRRFDTRFKNGEDSIFMYLISDRFGKVAMTSKNAVYYRRVRAGSAETIKKKTSIIVLNTLKMVAEFWKIYLKHPLRYNLRFLLAKSIGAVHWAIVQIKI